MRRGEATIGLRYLRDPSPDVVCEALKEEQLVIACGVRHRFAGQRVAALAELREEAWLAFPRTHDPREASADNLFAQFLVRGVGSLRWTPVDSLTAQKRLIEAGFGLALLPASSIREELASDSLATIDVRDLRVGNPVFAIVRKGGYLSPAAREWTRRSRRARCRRRGPPGSKRSRRRYSRLRKRPRSSSTCSAA